MQSEATAEGPGENSCSARAGLMPSPGEMHSPEKQSSNVPEEDTRAKRAAPAPTISRNLDIVISVVVVGGLMAAAWEISHAASGAWKDLSLKYIASLLIFVPIMTVLAVFERIFPAGPHKSISGWALNIRLTIIVYFGVVVARILGTEIASGLGAHFDIGWVDLRFARDNDVLALAGAFFLTVFIYDFFYYWTHLLQHKVPFLWQQHKVHHMDESINVSTRARADWGEFILTMASVIPAAILFKLDAPSAGLLGIAFAVIHEFWQVFNHANIKLHNKFLNVLFVGPQVHRIHHSRLIEHRHRNFAAHFTLWDIIFGTYHHPGRNEFPPTGIDEEPDVRTLGEAILLPFKGWMKMYRDWRFKNGTPLSPSEIREGR